MTPPVLIAIMPNSHQRSLGQAYSGMNHHSMRPLTGLPERRKTVGGLLAITIPEDRCTHGVPDALNLSEYLEYLVHFVYLLDHDHVVVFNLFDELEPFLYATGIAHVR
jgi:hypothetical protein